MYVSLFNRQGKGKPHNKLPRPSEEFAAQPEDNFVLDGGLDDLGCADHPCVQVAPGLIAHLGEMTPRLERTGQSVDG